MAVWEYGRIRIVDHSAFTRQAQHTGLQSYLDELRRPPLLMRLDINLARNPEQQQRAIARYLAQVQEEGWQLTDRLIFPDGYADLHMRRPAPGRDQTSSI